MEKLLDRRMLAADLDVSTTPDEPPESAPVEVAIESAGANIPSSSASEAQTGSADETPGDLAAANASESVAEERNTLDVNGDGIVTALDALLVVNAVNRGGNGGLGAANLDVNRDGAVDGVDFEAIVAGLNAAPPQQGALASVDDASVPAVIDGASPPSDSSSADSENGSSQPVSGEPESGSGTGGGTDTGGGTGTGSHCIPDDGPCFYNGSGTGTGTGTGSGNGSATGT